MKMNLTGAIEILKQHKHTTDKFKHIIGDQYVSEAIDTVVAEFEDNSDDMCYHECPSCGSRCNCNDQPCSCCQEKTYTAKDMEAFAEWLIGRNTEWISKLQRNETSKTLIKMWKERRAK